MPDMKHLNPLVLDLVEDHVWIAYERNYPHVALLPLGHSASASWPLFDASDRSANAVLDRRGGERVYRLKPGKDVIGVRECALSVDRLHQRRDLARTASTSASVANCPSSASLRPGSIPGHSPGVAGWVSCCR